MWKLYTVIQPVQYVEIQSERSMRSVSCSKVWDVQINLWYKHLSRPSTSCSCINVLHVCCYRNTFLFILVLCKAGCLLANVAFQLTCHISFIRFINQILIKYIGRKLSMDHYKYFALKVPSSHTVRKSRKWLANSDLNIIIFLNHAWKCTLNNCCIEMHWELV